MRRGLTNGQKVVALAGGGASDLGTSKIRQYPEMLADLQPGSEHRSHNRAPRAWALVIVAVVSIACFVTWKLHRDDSVRQDRKVQEYLDAVGD